MIIHTNKWYWGTTETIVIHDGVGIVEVQYDKDSNIAYVKGLSVDKRWQNKGIGTELMKLCEEMAGKNNRVFLQLCCHKGKDWLYEWYKRLGYETFSWDEHEFVMIKKLC